MRLKINLASGNSVENTLLTAFKSNTGSYVVFDAEKTDSTGLPVIMVSKLQGTQVSSIQDANEWGSVKDSLRSIVSGTPIEYINVAPELSGDDVFYKQLTLPVAYFDTLKNNYNPVAANTVDVAPAVDVAPVVASEPVQVVNPAPSVEPAPVMPTFDAPTPAPEAVQEAAPALDINPVQTPEMPQMPDINAMAVEPPVAPQPVNMEAPQVDNSSDFAQAKEEFLKACENVFDALVTKLNR